jgi:Ca2+-transporting ATPase
MVLWHQLDASAALTQLASDADRGLSEVESRRRLGEYGANELEVDSRISPVILLLEQFKNILVVILLVAVALSAFLGHTVEASAIAVIVLFAVLLGFVQEYRAERAIEALRKMAEPVATVIRDGMEIDIPSRELVPGDIIILLTGKKVPADGRIISAVNLQADEAALTGESLPVEKQSEPLESAELPVGDRRNMVYAGTALTYGRGRALVVATGLQTEFGKIAQMLKTVRTSKTPLQLNLDRVGRILGQAALIIVLIIVTLGLYRGQPLLEMFIFGIALAVAVVPEALPAVVTISLAIGVQRMVKRNALIRRLPAVETLGSVSVICSDKTGTLTKDEMTVRKIYVAGQMVEVSGSGYEPRGTFSLDGNRIAPSQPLKDLLMAAALASDAHLHSTVAGEPGSADGFAWRIKGDPTEGALIVAAAKAGLDKADLDMRFPRIGEIPFTAETKRMTTLHASNGGAVAYTKGAPEIILDSCNRQLSEIGETELTGTAKQIIAAAARRMASEALRVLALAYNTNATLRNAEREMIFLGLVGMLDPPRPEAKAAIDTCRRAGIKPVMITGDHPLTAQAIARELGLLNKADGSLIGSDLDAMSDDELAAKVESVVLYARVSPAHKLRVVAALQHNGHVVAMTGDGVNDAPALKKADIGVAMGITGTDVSKEAAAMTLIDDNFASIVAAVEEGRGVFDNIKKYLMFLLSCNIGEIGLMVGTSALGLPLPLSAVQLLYVNLATDGLPALALAVDPPEADLMRRAPRDPRIGIFTRPVVSLMLVGGLWSALVNLALFSWALASGHNNNVAMTMTFVSLVLIEFFKAYSFRSEKHSLMIRPFANKWLNLAITWELALLLIVVCTPFLQQVFGTVSLPWERWAIVVGAALTVLPVLELGKSVLRRGWFGALS